MQSESVFTSILGDVADINPKFDRSQVVDDAEPVSFLPMANVSEQLGAITDETYRPVKEVLKGFTPFKDRDLLVAKITPCFENGKIAHARISQRFGFGSTEFHVVRPHPDVLDDRYLFHFLRQDRVRVDGERNMTGSAGQRRVPKRFLEELQITLPSLPEQRRIAAILDKADALRQKRRAAIAKLDQLLQSVFLEMFGDPVTNPKAWDSKACNELFELSNGVNFSADERGSGTPVVDVKNMYNPGITVDCSRLYRITKPLSTKRLLEPGDILFVRSSVKQEGVGWPALFAGHSEPVAYCGFLIRGRRKKGANLDERYLIYALRQPTLRKLMISSSGKMALTNISQERLGTIKVPIPDQDIQRRFSAICSRHERMSRQYIEGADRLEKAFFSLQQRAFTGQL